MMIYNLVKYLVQTKSSLDKIFYKIVYHHIIYMCDFFVNLDDFFVVVCTNFHEDLVSTRYVPLQQTPNHVGHIPPTLP